MELKNITSGPQKKKGKKKNKTEKVRLFGKTHQ